MIKDDALAKYMFKRCCNFVPRAFEGGLLVNLNEKIRFLKYDRPGDHFFPHFDAPTVRNELEKSTITFQVYLSDKMEGGETVFIENCFPEVQLYIKYSFKFLYREGMNAFQRQARHFSSVNSNTSLSVL